MKQWDIEAHVNNNKQQGQQGRTVTSYKPIRMQNYFLQFFITRITKKKLKIGFETYLAQTSLQYP